MRGHGALLLALSLGCECAAEPAEQIDDLEDARAFLITYADVLEAGYADAAAGARSLRTSLAPLSEGDATEASLEAAREAWIASRPAYLQTEVARFYGGPIDGEHGPEPRINGWPLDEAYLDYVLAGDGTRIEGGLVNVPETLPTIDPSALSAANLRGGEENIAAGYHAIEFLLWGQDVSRDGPGARPYTDFIDDPALATAPYPERRRAMLGALGVLLEDDLTTVADAWQGGSETNFRAAFLRLPPREAVRLVLLGMASLAGTELVGERLNVPYLTREPEDEHSCFSDTTQRDHPSDARGLRNVYLGRYARPDGTLVEGPSLSDVVARRDRELDARVRGELDAVLAALEAIPSPFDRAIQGPDDGPGRTAIREAIRELRGLTASLVQLGELLGIRLNLVV